MKSMVLGLAALLCAATVSYAQDMDAPAAPAAPPGRISIVLASLGTSRQPRELDITGATQSLCGPNSRHCSLPCDIQAFPEIYKMRGKPVCSVVYRCGQETASASARQHGTLDMSCEAPTESNPYP